MKLYRRFSEHNQWEGETWHFYIPIEGNEAAIAKLAKRIEGLTSYEIHSDTFDEPTIAKLTKYNDEPGYMDKHNILSGLLDMKKLTPTKGNPDPLYKGGLRDAMVKPRRKP